MISSVDVVVYCDVCDGTDLRKCDPIADVVECAECGYRFVSPRPRQVEIAEVYSDPNFYESWLAHEVGRAKMWRKRLRRLPRLAPGSRVLDVGAGIGTFLALARDQAGWTVAGSEISRSAVQLAWERHRLELMVGQFEELPVPAETFDLITLWHVLEHVPSPSRLLEACHRALVPGGWLVLAVPNDSSARWSMEQLKALLRRREPARYQRLARGSEIHLSHFNQPILAQLLRQHGFRATRWSIDDHYPNPQLRTNTRVALHRAILRVTGLNFGQTIFSVSQRAAHSDAY